MEKNHVYQNNWFRQIFLLSFLLSTWPSPLQASERIHTAHFSPAPGASAVIWVAKEARLPVSFTALGVVRRSGGRSRGGESESPSPG